MTLLEQLIAYGVSKGVLTGDGVDSFRDFTPEAPANCVTFYEYSGDAPSPYIDAVHRSVQVKVRATTAESSRAKALALYNLFNPAAESRRIDLTATTWCQFYVRQPPFKLSQDEQDKITYCFNLGITTNNLE